MTALPTSTARFEALDAWRGICALLVALEHLGVDNVLHHNELVHHGYRFVDFFFVLSGFVIAHAYRERLSAGWSQVRSFLIRRLGRLWPLHMVVLLVFIGFQLGVTVAHLSVGTLAERNTFASVPANVLLIHSWGFVHHSTWNNPSWSISTEVFAYGVFALLCALLPDRWVSWLAAFLLVASAAVLVWVAPLGMRSTFDFGLFRCVFGFMFGVLIRALWQRYRPRVGTVGEILVVTAVIGAVMLLPYDASSLLVTPIFALAVWIFASEDGALSTVMRHRWPQRLGAWSYSIYMVHAFIALAFLSAAMLATQHGIPLFERVGGVSTIVGSPSVTTTIVVAYVIAIVAVSRFSYRYIELVGQRLAAGFASPRKPK